MDFRIDFSISVLMTQVPSRGGKSIQVNFIWFQISSSIKSFLQNIVFTCVLILSGTGKFKKRFSQNSLHTTNGFEPCVLKPNLDHRLCKVLGS